MTTPDMSDPSSNNDQAKHTQFDDVPASLKDADIPSQSGLEVDVDVDYSMETLATDEATISSNDGALGITEQVSEQERVFTSEHDLDPNNEDQTIVDGVDDSVAESSTNEKNISTAANSDFTNLPSRPPSHHSHQRRYHNQNHHHGGRHNNFRPYQYNNRPHYQHNRPFQRHRGNRPPRPFPRPPFPPQQMMPFPHPNYPRPDPSHFQHTFPTPPNQPHMMNRPHQNLHASTPSLNPSIQNQAPFLIPPQAGPMLSFPQHPPMQTPSMLPTNFQNQTLQWAQQPPQQHPSMIPMNTMPAMPMGMGMYPAVNMMMNVPAPSTPITGMPMSAGTNAMFYPVPNASMQVPTSVAINQAGSIIPIPQIAMTGSAITSNAAESTLSVNQASVSSSEPGKKVDTTKSTSASKESTGSSTKMDNVPIKDATRLLELISSLPHIYVRLSILKTFFQQNYQYVPKFNITSYVKSSPDKYHYLVVRSDLQLVSTVKKLKQVKKTPPESVQQRLQILFTPGTFSVQFVFKMYKDVYGEFLGDESLTGESSEIEDTSDMDEKELLQKRLDYLSSLDVPNWSINADDDVVTVGKGNWMSDRKWGDDWLDYESEEEKPVPKKTKAKQGRKRAKAEEAEVVAEEVKPDVTISKVEKKFGKPDRSTGKMKIEIKLAQPIKPPEPKPSPPKSPSSPSPSPPRKQRRPSTPDLPVRENVRGRSPRKSDRRSRSVRSKERKKEKAKEPQKLESQKAEDLDLEEGEIVESESESSYYSDNSYSDSRRRSYRSKKRQRSYSPSYSRSRSRSRSPYRSHRDSDYHYSRSRRRSERGSREYRDYEPEDDYYHDSSYSRRRKDHYSPVRKDRVSYDEADPSADRYRSDRTRRESLSRKIEDDREKNDGPVHKKPRIDDMAEEDKVLENIVEEEITQDSSIKDEKMNEVVVSENDNQTEDLKVEGEGALPQDVEMEDNAEVAQESEQTITVPSGIENLDDNVDNDEVNASEVTEEPKEISVNDGDSTEK